MRFLPAPCCTFSSPPYSNAATVEKRHVHDKGLCPWMGGPMFSQLLRLLPRRSGRKTTERAGLTGPLFSIAYSIMGFFLSVIYSTIGLIRAVFQERSGRRFLAHRQTVWHTIGPVFGRSDRFWAYVPDGLESMVLPSCSARVIILDGLT